MIDWRIQRRAAKYTNMNRIMDQFKNWFFGEPQSVLKFESNPELMSRIQFETQRDLDNLVRIDFHRTMMFDESVITGSSISMNGVLFKDKQTLLEYLEYYFDDNNEDAEIKKSLREPDFMLKFVEKFHSHILHALELYGIIYLCDERYKLLLVVNNEQQEEVKNDVGVELRSHRYGPPNFIVGSRAIFGYDLQYEKKMDLGVGVKNARKLNK